MMILKMHIRKVARSMRASSRMLRRCLNIGTPFLSEWVEKSQKILGRVFWDFGISHFLLWFLVFLGFRQIFPISLGGRIVQRQQGEQGLLRRRLSYSC